ncbi:MAG: energy-coupling factor ABC transporter permease [Candidatus Omnitrophica bacterium]|nr:energy-coupling factor ABC transporter permease [Candidatus Omnitrophota bacterium]MCM8793234.1 energy-coupling factor ABC transporter permease [Candidatus Omnitrophota bacterium]
MQIIFLFLLFLYPAYPVYAMHIAEGVLEFRWVFFWWLWAIPFIFLGLYRIQKLKKRNPLFLPLLAAVGAGVFVFSLIPLPVPITGTTSHPTGTGLSCLLLGVFSTGVISFLSLLIQAVFLGHGGLTTLGANIVSLGIAGPMFALSVYYLLKFFKFPLGIRVFFVGLLADLTTYVVTSGQLALSLVKLQDFWETFMKFLLLFLPIQLPLAILEGFLTLGIIRYVSIHRPQIVEHLL